MWNPRIMSKQFVVLLLAVCLFGLPAQAKYGGGTGEPNDPYLIFNADQLNTIGIWDNFFFDWDKHFRLMADIDLAGYTGTAFNIIGSFSGVFDGNGHTISNFSYTSTDSNSVGLFRYVHGESAVIKDLILINPNIDAGTGNYVGSLVGKLNGGSITNCYIDGGIVAGHWHIGGMVGYNNGIISNCCATSDVTGTMCVGGLVGHNNSGTITNCYAMGSVSGDTWVGGLVGLNNWGTITNCYAMGSASGEDYVGGLVGYNWHRTIINCFSTVSVTGTTSVGGLVGHNGDGTVYNSFWDIETSGQTTSDGGTDKTTAEMQTASTFYGWACGGSGSFWTLDEGADYPRLWWENMQGEYLTKPSYGGGSGGPSDPYLIYTAEQLKTIGLVFCDLDKHFKLMADIDLGAFTGKSFNIIGNDTVPFTGVFEGNGYTISNFSYTSTGISNIGLFGYVDNANAQIKDLGIIESNIDAGTGDYVGLLVGYLRAGIVTNCCVEGGSVLGRQDVGGLVGRINDGTVTNCCSTVSVEASEIVGGLIGTNDGTIANSYSTGSIEGYGWIGGLVGRSTGTITDCYSNAGVSGEYLVGGLVGENEDRIANCFSTGGILGDSSVGGLVGSNQGSIIDSFWDIESSGQTTSDGGTGKTTAEMQTASTFSAWVSCNPVWTIDEGQYYPRLWWENAPGESLTLRVLLSGSGTQTDPYLIYTADELNMIGLFPCEYNKHFKLMADIDLSSFTGTAFNIIGNFSGIFDGNGHTISNFSYNSIESSDVGLLAYVSGTIKDLRLVGPNINVGTGDYVGSLAGRNGGNINNCYVESGSISGDYRVGGLVGYNYGTITNCYSAGSVTGDDDVGGLVGDNYGTIIYCYSTSGVLGDNRVGGLVGYNYKTITKCYSTGSVSGSGNNVGGLVGRNSGMVTASFWDVQTSLQTTSGGGTGKTTAEMQDPNTFLDAGWDFVGEWENGPNEEWAEPPGGGYPILWWQLSPLPPLPTFSGGTGEPEDPYLISTANDLNRIGHNQRLMAAHFKIINDISLTEVNFFTIGSQPIPFTGVFDGNDHAISNFTYDSNDRNYIGLFEYASQGEIKNLGLIDPNIEAGTGIYVGALVGRNGGNINNCYVESGSVSGDYRVGGLVGYNPGTITNCYSTGSVTGDDDVGGLVGDNYGTITNCDSTGSVTGDDDVGGLVGYNYGTITNCYSAGSVTGDDDVGGLVGYNYYGAITNCCAAGDVTGNYRVGGLVGRNYYGAITNCCAAGDVTGNYDVGGLIGSTGPEPYWGNGTITSCYAAGSVLGEHSIGGLVGTNSDTIINSYSTGSVSGTTYIGGLVGQNGQWYGWWWSWWVPGEIVNSYSSGRVVGEYQVGGLVGYSGGEVAGVMDSFWDIETSGQATSDGGTGKTTAEMRMINIFIETGWDFNTPVWTIDEGVDYPRLWWETPVLHAEPEITLGMSNTIFWHHVVGAIEYYAECADDASFTNIVSASGWITETSCEFTGLQVGQKYWYSVKARNAAGAESQWSNVESSLQCNLIEAVEIMLDPQNLKNKNMKNILLNKVKEVLEMIDEGLYKDVLNKLQNDILLKTNGCAETGKPDKNDWIITCEEQCKVYPLVIETIEHVRSLME